MRNWGGALEKSRLLLCAKDMGESAGQCRPCLPLNIARIAPEDGRCWEGTCARAALAPPCREKNAAGALVQERGLFRGRLAIEVFSVRRSRKEALGEEGRKAAQKKGRLLRGMIFYRANEKMLDG